MQINDLVKQISQVDRVDLGILRQIRYEIKNANLNWIESYKDYQSSGWATVSLINPSGSSSAVTIHDGIGRETEIMTHLPSISLLLSSLGLNYMWVRIAQLAPNSYLWEHIDYTELNRIPKLRLHIPIVSAAEAEMVFADTSVHMACGYIWKLDPQIAHGACNRSQQNRIHIIIDCYINDRLEQMIKSQVLEDKFITKKPEVNSSEKLVRAKSLASAGFFDAAERLLLKSYFTEQSQRTSYDPIIEMYSELNINERMKTWVEKKKLFMGLGIVG
jgi:hypothetical protein